VGEMETTRENLLALAQNLSEQAKDAGGGPLRPRLLAEAKQALDAYWATFPESQRKAGPPTGKAPPVG
jgi:hypothetical protein